MDGTDAAYLIRLLEADNIQFKNANPLSFMPASVNEAGEEWRTRRLARLDKIKDELIAISTSPVCEFPGHPSFPVHKSTRTGSCGVFVLTVAGVAALAVLGIVAWPSARQPAPKPPEPSAAFRELRAAGGAPRTVYVLTDPKSGHRWLVIGNQGTAMLPLTPEEFPE